MDLPRARRTQNAEADKEQQDRPISPLSPNTHTLQREVWPPLTNLPGCLCQQTMNTAEMLWHLVFKLFLAAESQTLLEARSS